MRWGLVAMFCAACGGQGVDLEVDADVTFDRVELFLTYDVCRNQNGEACDQGVGWPNQSSRPPGTIYVLSDDEKLISTTTLEGSSAVLHLEAVAGFEEPKAIAIAAYRGNHVVAAHVLWGSRIPLHSAERWKVHLLPTDDASVKIHEPPPLDAPLHRALAWPREASPDVPDPSGYAGCFVFQEWTGAEWASTYFVPDSDKDCDGTPPDCTPFWNHFNPAMARCVTKSGTAGFCTLGTPTCSDETPGTTCMANTPITCLPQEVCTQCSDTTDLGACLRDQVADANSGLFTYAECRFALDADTQGPCTGMSGNKLVYKILTPCPNGNPLLREPAMPFSGGTTKVTTPDGAELAVSATSDAQSCFVELEWKQGTIAMDYTYVLVVNLPLRQMLVPVTFGLDAPMTLCPTTPEPGACVVHGPGAQDSLFQCIRSQ